MGRSGEEEQGPQWEDHSAEVRAQHSRAASVHINKCLTLFSYVASEVSREGRGLVCLLRKGVSCTQDSREASKQRQEMLTNG